MFVKNCFLAGKERTCVAGYFSFATVPKKCTRHNKNARNRILATGKIREISVQIVSWVP